MKHLSPYLFFNGNCREAMEFYKECLGGELWMQTIGESPIASTMPAEMHNTIMHAAIMKDGVMLMASDNMGEEQIVIGSNVEVCIDGSSKEEIETYFAKLSEGGTITMPLKKEFFGLFGSLTDKFGVKWMVIYDDSAQQ